MTKAAPASIVADGRVFQNTQSMPRPQSSAVYSIGATVEAGAWRNASVMPCWPMVPSTPTAAIHGQCAASIYTQPGKDSAVQTTATTARNENTIVEERSVRVMTRATITPRA